MGILELLQISAIPATLVVLGGLLVLHREPMEKGGRNFLLYLLACLVLIDLIILLASLFWETPYDQAKFYLSSSSLPLLAGILALTVLQLGSMWRLGSLSRRQILLAALLSLILIGLGALFFGSQNLSPLSGLGIVLFLGLVLALVWAAGLRWRWLAGIFLLLALAGMIAFNEPVAGWLRRNVDSTTPIGFNIALSVISFSFALLTVPLIAVLVQRALKPRVQEPAPDDDTDRAEAAQLSSAKRKPRRTAVLQLGAAALLLAGLLYTIYWTCIWDHTSDGLGGIFLSQPGVILGIGAGMLLTIFSTGWRRMAGLLFMVLVPLMLNQTFKFGWQAWYHEITEERAARIAAALEDYHARTGRYPQELKELAPRDLLIVPRPVILQGESWCYQSTSDSYRLGSVFREFWSSPWSIQIYASAGEPLPSVWACDARLEELKASYDASLVYQPIEQEERLPESEVPVARQSIAPAVEGSRLRPGRWSPDGRYLTFSSDDSLGFLDVSEGQVCSGEGEISIAADAWASSAWLTDGRVLVVTRDGDLLLQEPCGTADALPGGDAASFSEVMAADHESGSVLLKTEADFWILDGATLTLKQVDVVAPNPYELHWDRAAWLTGGARLAISRLNGRDSSEGSTLYIIDGQNGEVLLSLPRASAYDQSAPGVEWLSKSELLLIGGGTLAILDLSADPPQERNALQELLGLDLEFPDEISGMGSVIDHQGGGYYLAVRANHPRNQSLYLYSSISGQVQAFEHQMHSLLFFPDGQLLWMPKFEPEPTYQDEYDLVWVGEPDRSGEHLTVTGHTPRSYPTLFVEAAPGGKGLYFGSSQGVSLVSIADGTLLGFWDLGGGTASVTSPENPAAKQRAVAVVDGVGLFIIPGLSE
jgi:hypothetical protein